MLIEHDMHYKEQNPERTVKQLVDLFRKNEIECEEVWMNKSSVNTHSLRVNIVGTNGVGSNGKGVNKEYARASGYAELMERYQNFALTSLINLSDEMGFEYFYDEQYTTTEDLVKNNSPFVDVTFKHLDKSELNVLEKTILFDKLFSINEKNVGSYLTIPYYSFEKDKTVDIPIRLTYPFYGTHGMCAGNTYAEAMVQGISEIFERHVLLKVINEKVVLPDIPEDYIAKSAYIYEMYCKLKQFENYSFMIKDCSFGGKYPVVALIIIEKDTGYYGINFGSHPNINIAIERTFTEASQGQDILKYAQRSKIDFSNKRVLTRNNFMNIFHISKGCYPYQIFGKEPTYQFTPFMDTSNKGNVELMNYWVKKVRNEGYDILVRDNSILGFPTLHIIIPNFSELVQIDEQECRFENTIPFIIELLKNPSAISFENINYLITVLEHYSSDYYQNSLKSYYKRGDDKKYPFEQYNLDCPYLLMNLHLMKENLEKSKLYAQLLFTSERLESRDKIFIEATTNYLSARQNKLNHMDAISYLSIFFSYEIIEYIDYIYCDVEKIIEKLYSKDIPTIENDSKLKNIMCKLKQAEIKRNYKQSNFKEVLDFNSIRVSNY